MQWPGGHDLCLLSLSRHSDSPHTGSVRTEVQWCEVLRIKVWGDCPICTGKTSPSFDSFDISIDILFKLN